jgi:hypothetical protein
MATFYKIKNRIQIAGAQAENTLRRLVRRVLLSTFIAIAVAVCAGLATVNWLMPHAHNIYNAAKLVDGEARGESYVGQKAAFATIVARVESHEFPDSWHDVLFQTYTNNVHLLQYNAMGDYLHEDLSTESGQTILRRVAWWYLQVELGIFQVPTGYEDAHSYCVRDACERHASYFGTLEELGTIGDHVFFGPQAQNVTVSTRSIRPVPRPGVLAPTRSPRPVPRPQSLSLDEQLDEEIDALVAQVLAAR